MSYANRRRMARGPHNPEVLIPGEGSGLGQRTMPMRHLQRREEQRPLDRLATLRDAAPKESLRELDPGYYSFNLGYQVRIVTALSLRTGYPGLIMRLPWGTEVHELVSVEDGFRSLLVIKAALTIHNLAGLASRELWTIGEGTPALPPEALARPIPCPFMTLFDGGEI